MKNTSNSELSFLEMIPDKNLIFEGFSQEGLGLNKFLFKTIEGKEISVFASNNVKQKLLAHLKKGEIYNKY